MKRLWVAVALLGLVASLCVCASLYQHRQINRMLHTLDRLERVYTAGDMQTANQLAEQLQEDYEAAGRVLYCFIAHGDLAESQETVALLPALLRQGRQEELEMEIARLREQLGYLQTIDDPLWQNVL